MKNSVLTILVIAMLGALVAAVILFFPPSVNPQDGDALQDNSSQSTSPTKDEASVVVCPRDDIDHCPAGCSVCPPCDVCSSIACLPTTECQARGFAPDWYEDVKPQIITTFAECVAAGFPVMESFPRQCSAYGRTYTEDIVK